AKTGMSRPSIVMFGRPRQGRGLAGSLIRRTMIDTWAIVNESIAPNAYMFPRKSVCPGMRTMAATPQKIRIDRYGVRKRGWTDLSDGGSWRWMPIEYVRRETPMIPALVAMNRIVAARMPT